MRRREFITLLGGVASWPLTANAQQPHRARRVGVLMGYAESDPDAQAWYAAFRQGLQKLGWTEGQNTQIDTRWARPDDPELMRRFAKELVALQPDLLLSSTTPTTSFLLEHPRGSGLGVIADNLVNIGCAIEKQTPSPSLDHYQIPYAPPLTRRDCAFCGT